MLSHGGNERRDLRGDLVIVPSLRAAQRLRKALALEMGGAGWLPKCMTLSEWMREVTGWRALAPLEALAMLYEAHRKLAPEQTPGFSAFQPWGEVALRDFNACDHHLIPPATFFKNLCDLKELDVWGVQDWSFDNPELTPGQTAYLQSFLLLHPLYQALEAFAETEGAALGGAIARRAASSGALTGPAHVFVVGMGALTPAEMTFLKRWEGAGRLTWMWDADRAYVDGGHGQFEAGIFIRKQANPEDIQRLPQRLAAAPPAVDIVGCSSAVYEVAWVRQHIASLSEAERDKTAIVLPGAATLPLLLQGLGDILPTCNITMGISWEETPAAELLEALWILLLRSGDAVRHEEIATLCGHPIPLAIFGKKAMLSDAGSVMQRAAERHQVWLRLGDFDSLSSGPVTSWMRELLALKSVLRNLLESPVTLLDWSRSLLQRLEATHRPDPWCVAGWRKWTRSLAAFAEQSKYAALLDQLRDLRELLRMGMRGERVDLLGEPDQGLQIMGLIETRALDFKRVIVLDCNEQLLPKTGMDDSFLPGELRAAHELPGRHEREAIYAYYLYRLLNRAEHVTLLHREGDDEKEMSRYLKQLQQSFRPDGTNLLPITTRQVQAPLPQRRPDPVPLQMTERMRESLVRWATESGISPSALNVMVACQRDFAYKYLLRLREPGEIEESMDVSTFGSILHEALEHLFKNKLSKPLQVEDFDAALQALDSELGRAIAKNYNPTLVEEGENRLLHRMIRATARKMLKSERGEIDRGAQRTLISLEEVIEARFDGSGAFAEGILLRGTADRLEREEGILTVVDYKSGNVHEKDVMLRGSDLGEALDAGTHPKALQLLVYSAIGLQKFQEHTARAAIRSGKNAYAGALAFQWQKQDRIEPAHVDEFIAWLDARLVTLQGKTTGLEHADSARYCAYCQTWQNLD